MSQSKPRPDASASAASTDSDAKADPKSVTGAEQPAPQRATPERTVDDTDETQPEQPTPEGDASAKPADKPEAAPADTGDAEPAPQVPDQEPAADAQPAVDYKALAEAARAELDGLKAQLATQESLKSVGLAPELADYVTLNSPDDAQKLAAIIAPQPQAAPFAPVGDDDTDENITTIGSRIFGRR
jgi:protein TonB|nr:MAG TPA: hypothetical protein [Caudoviricetes sp.]